MITVVWPSHRAKYAEIWRVLDLSGLTPHPRASEQAVRAQCVFLNGDLVQGLRDRVAIGRKFVLEVRAPQKVLSREIFLVHQTLGPKKPRSQDPLVYHRRG